MYSADSIAVSVFFCEEEHFKNILITIFKLLNFIKNQILLQKYFFGKTKHREIKPRNSSRFFTTFAAGFLLLL
jgi:hypothetical protein